MGHSGRGGGLGLSPGCRGGGLPPEAETAIDLRDALLILPCAGTGSALRSEPASVSTPSAGLGPCLGWRQHWRENGPQTTHTAGVGSPPPGTLCGWPCTHTLAQGSWPGHQSPVPGGEVSARFHPPTDMSAGWAGGWAEALMAPFQRAQKDGGKAHCRGQSPSHNSSRCCNTPPGREPGGRAQGRPQFGH